ncbi:MAG: serine/threonine protein kinase [Myxococcales bacterium]|nr:serine/threonine protein kinase [Myxococcales bacterium]
MLAGKYELITPIGRGGTAVVYRALQRPMDRPVAVKILRDDLEADMRHAHEARFRREAALASRLSHPHVVTVHDADEHEGTCFLVMELLEGESLAEALARGPLQAASAAEVGIDVGRALRHAHQAGMVHRDVKPSNVMLVRDDEGLQRAKLMDFGLVKQPGVPQLEITLDEHYVGTPRYMAPEQVEGREADARTDVYGLGALLYRSLTGVNAAPGTPMAQAAPEVVVPPALEAIVQRAMSLRPEGRFVDADAMVDALQGWLVAARGPQVAVEPRRPGRRLALWGLAGAGSVAAGVVGVGLVVIGAVGMLAADEPVPAMASMAPAPRAQVVPAPLPRIVVDGIRFERAEAIRALRFVNEASGEALAAAGIYPRGVEVILRERPFDSLEDFGHTKGIGKRTVLAVQGAESGP